MSPCTTGSCCGSACVDLATDAKNCGTCDKTCSGGQTCCGGSCGTKTPSCATADGGTKSCGDDGCGGTCGAACPSGTICEGGSCAPCPANFCGGTCGNCPAGSYCAGGTCGSSPCVGKCTGKACGDDDGCGSPCTTGTCSTGTCSTNGICTGGCMPSCAGICGNDGCGGQCGTCTGTDTCQGGQCVCKPLCTTQGWLCGDDGCGGSCGSCSGNTPYCSPGHFCTGDPSVEGCSDGSREGFVSTSTYPMIAACAATWNGSQNLRSTSTGTPCGNPSGGVCPGPADACATGWHVCMNNGWPGELHDRMSAGDCNSAAAGTGQFLAGSDPSVSGGYCACTVTPLPAGCGAVSNVTPIACGSQTQIVCGGNGNCANMIWPNNTPTATVTQCNQAAAGNGITGVLCCKDPPVVGQ